MITIVFIVSSMYEPMVGELLDHSYRAQVKMQLAGLKTALISYNDDLHHFPFTGIDAAAPEAYAAAWQLMTTDKSDQNILKDARVPVCSDGWERLGMSPKVLAAKWRGPYINLDSNAFVDKWGNPIAYYCLDDGKFLKIFLHSAGEDREFDMERPELSSFAKVLELKQSFSWQHAFQIFPRNALDAHRTSYNGDDLLLEVAKIPKNKLKTCAKTPAEAENNLRM